MNPSIMVVAGEVSGDLHAAAVMRALQARHPQVEFWGIGGRELRAAGMEVVHDVDEMAVLGLTEVLRRYFFFRRVFREMLAMAVQRRPVAILLVDYPGFNLAFARAAARHGLKVLYYICPQVWAWHRSRTRVIARAVEHLMVIFPFEVDFFAGMGLRVDFVGHPLVDEARAACKAEVRPLPWGGAPRVAVLPGSRRQEVLRILPVMWRAARLVEQHQPGVSFLLAAPTREIGELGREIITRSGWAPQHWNIIVGRTREVLRQADAAMVASGTATLETALMDCPMIIVYRAAWLTYALGRMLVRIPWIGMVNVVAGRAVCREFIQGHARAEALAQNLLPLLEDTPQRRVMLDGLAEVRRKLGNGGAAQRAAELIAADVGLRDEQLDAGA